MSSNNLSAYYISVVSESASQLFNEQKEKLSLFFKSKGCNPSPTIYATIYGNIFFETKILKANKNVFSLNYSLELKIMINSFIHSLQYVDNYNF